MKVGEKKGILLVLGTAFISGLAIFLNKFAVTAIDPYVFTGLKNTLVAIFLLSFLLGTKEIKTFKKLSLKNWLALFLIGLVGGSLPFLLFFKGLSLTSAPQAAFIHKNMFLLVAILAPLFLKEKLDKGFFMAAFFLLMGNALLLGKTFPFFWNKGNLLVLLATFLWAIENIISKRLLRKLPAKIVAWGRIFFGSGIIISFLAFTGRLGVVFDLEPLHWFWVLLTSVLLLSYVVSWYSGLKHLRVSIATSILTLGSLITSLLSVFSGTVLGIRETAGIMLLMVGLILLLEFKRTLGFLKSMLRLIHAWS